MNVKELKDRLANLPDNMPVIVSDQTGGGGHDALVWNIRVNCGRNGMYWPNVRGPNDGVSAIWIE